jgi:hypothetical protein
LGKFLWAAITIRGANEPSSSGLALAQVQLMKIQVEPNQTREALRAERLAQAQLVTLSWLARWFTNQ